MLEIRAFILYYAISYAILKLVAYFIGREDNDR